VRHQAAAAVWGPGRVEGFEARDLGIAAGTSGVASARVARRAPPGPASPSSLPAPPTRHDAEFFFTFVLAGAATLTCEGKGTQRLGPSHAFVVPSGLSHALADCSADLELLEVALPAGFHTRSS
jgi:mannose-6-phosphate isomerase-like protein (cupin superfamily)